MSSKTLDTVLKAGYVSLTDAAPLIIAHELGFDRQYGFTFDLVQLKSWTAIRDELAFGHFACAQIPAALSLAMHLGISGKKTAMKVPLLLGFGGNAITISKTVYQQSLKLYKGNTLQRSETALMLKPLIEHRKAYGMKKLCLGVVHAYSSHNYELRAWLSYAGINPDSDVDIIVVPRAKTVQFLQAGDIDGFCVGDPWGQLAVDNGAGVILATNVDLYPNSPEKVLGMSQHWVRDNPGKADGIIQAVKKAQRWMSRSENYAQVAYILSRDNYLSVSTRLIERSLNSEPEFGQTETSTSIEKFIDFHRPLSVMPTNTMALWILSQMRRWGQVSQGQEANIMGVFSPQLSPANDTDDSQDLLNSNPAKDAFDGVEFNATDIETYSGSFPINAL